MKSVTSSAIVVLTVFAILFPGIAAAGDRFTDNGDGTVTDHKLHLMWAKSSNIGNISWHEAEKWTMFTFPDTIPANYTDWRLPTLGELKSLYLKDKKNKGYESNCGRIIRITPEIVLDCAWIWTSEKRNITAVVYNFQRGYHYTDRMVNKRDYRVLPVRSMKSK